MSYFADEDERQRAFDALVDTVMDIPVVPDRIFGHPTGDWVTLLEGCEDMPGPLRSILMEVLARHFNRLFPPQDEQ